MYIWWSGSSQALGILCNKKDTNKTFPSHPLKSCTSAYTHLLQQWTLLWKQLWCACEMCCHFLLNFFFVCKKMTFEPNLVSQGRAGSHFKQVLEIRWLRTGWNSVLHRKLLSVRGMTRPIVMVQDPILSPFFWPLPLNSIPQTFQNFNTKSEIHCLSYRDKLTCITRKLSKQAISNDLLRFCDGYFFFWSDILVHYSVH